MPNRLVDEASPYLRQHADNPVDWWPWREDALAAARAQGKPILLSIGYSACHWCHVMAHESFEDAATAALMNELYICIKVDREERPDLDKIYQLAQQALTRRSGGWPLTVFLAPDDHLPFYAGTYFPREPRYGMPPFSHILQQVRAWWDTRRDEVRAQNSALAEFLAEHGRADASGEAFDHAPLRAALDQIQGNFDPDYGGHIGAPKFPHCPELELLFELELPEMAELTLRRIAEGGIHDQLGGGFARYSVDERWEIPHFEKMLYDNAQLLPLYARMAQREPLFAAAADGIVGWLAREMTAPSGGFYAALDADSEHEEGKFYVWQRDEVRALLDDAEYAVVQLHYGFDRAPNFEQHAWNPLIALPIDAVASTLGVTAQEAQQRLAGARTKLFAARSERVRPGLDDKILTAWNALMVSALARTARMRGDAALVTHTARALDHLHAAAWRDGRLYAKTGADSSLFPAYLDDHAFLLDALLEILQCRFSERDLHWAIALAEALIERFEDREQGGFFFTAHDHEQLIQRSKSWTDDATPSGNGIAARGLLRLGHLLGETRYVEAAERTLRAAYSTMQQMPQACCSLLRVLNDLLDPRTHVVVRFGDEPNAQAWRDALAHSGMQRLDAYFIPSSAERLPGTLGAQQYMNGGIAFICRGTQCLPPLRDAATLGEHLR